MRRIRMLVAWLIIAVGLVAGTAGVAHAVSLTGCYMGRGSIGIGTDPDGSSYQFCDGGVYDGERIG